MNKKEFGFLALGGFLISLIVSITVLLTIKTMIPDQAAAASLMKENMPQYIIPIALAGSILSIFMIKKKK